MPENREDLLQRMVKHGAEEVPVSELFQRSEIVWQIGANESISKTCVRLEEFITSAARNAQDALKVIDRMHNSDGLRDNDLLTALKKYVEDTCEAIKVIDNILKNNSSSLNILFVEVPNESKSEEISWRSLIGRRVEDTCEAIKVIDNILKNNSSSLNILFVEVPNESKSEEISWRSLIGRRDVIAHGLLTVDNEKVYREAVRDFGNLHQLLSRTYFVPVKTDLNSGRGFSPAIRGEAIKKLSPAEANKTPNIGESLIFICDDKHQGFVSLRLGRSEKNRALIAFSHGLSSVRISFYSMNSDNIVSSRSESQKAGAAG